MGGPLGRGTSDLTVFLAIGVLIVVLYTAILVISDSGQVRKDVASINRTLRG